MWRGCKQRLGVPFKEKSLGAIGTFKSSDGSPLAPHALAPPMCHDDGGALLLLP